jgi:hypothetical protein
MSVSEFFVDHGLNSGEDYDDWMDNYAYIYEGQAYNGRSRSYQPPVFGLDASKLENTTTALEPLDESKLDHFAKAGGWYKLWTKKNEAPMASYYGDHGMKLDFALSSGTVASYTDRPMGRCGERSEVYRCVIDIHQAEAIFQNPRSPPTAAAEPTVQISSQQETSFLGSKDQEETSKTATLNESGLDGMAVTHGWTKLSTETSQAPMTSYSFQDTRLNFWLSTGTVGSYLDHPSQGKTQLFRRQVDMQQAEEIFQNPRVHTGAGYQRCAAKPTSVGKPEEKRARRKGRKGKGGRKRKRGPCRNGSQCTRAGCWFDHP